MPSPRLSLFSPVSLLALVLAASGADALAQAGAGVYKCESNGKVVYTDKPCTEGQLSIIDASPAAGPNSSHYPRGATPWSRSISPRASEPPVEQWQPLYPPNQAVVCNALRQRWEATRLKYQNVSRSERGRYSETEYLEALQAIDRERLRYGCWR